MKDPISKQIPNSNCCNERKVIMKNVKKLLAMALALMLVFSLALTANAAGMPDTGTVKITNAAAGETYTFYRVYDIESVGNGGVIYTTNTIHPTAIAI